MNFQDAFVRMFRKFLPMPFTIAVLLTVFTFLMALLLTVPQDASVIRYVPEVAGFWETGFWELLAFTMQMMLILVLGHVLALTPIVDRMIKSLLQFCNTTASSAFMVASLTIIVTLFNWGLGLIFGAIFARKVGEHAKRNGININYPVIGSAGYAGFMVWHGGLSGSAPLIISDANHFLVEQIGVIPLSNTIFSPMNIAVSLMLLAVIPAFFFWLGKKSTPLDFKVPATKQDKDQPASLSGAEKLDFSLWFGRIFGGAFIVYGFYKAVILPDELSLNFLNINFINFMLFGLGVFLHGSFVNFVRAVEKSIKSSAGVMVQFPLYAGIMGMMKYSGLMVMIADFFVSISTTTTFPIFTLISAGIVNVLVPSGGGQWAVQGPIIVEAAQQLGVSLEKSIMALAYGDQLTNMIQPIWALPLLGITGLKVQEILPYTLMTMVLGGLIFVCVLLVF